MIFITVDIIHKYLQTADLEKITGMDSMTYDKIIDKEAIFIRNGQIVKIPIEKLIMEEAQEVITNVIPLYCPICKETRTVVKSETCFQCTKCGNISDL